MATASEQIAGISFRGVQILALDQAGYPVVDAVTEYSGLRIVGAKALTINRPAWQNVYATGDDHVLAAFMLPPQEGASGELRVGAFDMTAEELLGDLTIKTVDEHNLLPFGTDVVALPQVCILAWREAKSVATGDEGRSHYQFILIPRATITPNGGPFDERAVGDRTMSVLCHVTDAWPWGEELDPDTDGCAEMQGADGTCEYVPRLCSFVGDGSEDEFAFGVEAVSTDKISIYVDGVLTTAGVTPAVDGLTFSSPPADGAKIVVFMEVAA
jgi:hypothetical protein